MSGGRRIVPGGVPGFNARRRQAYECWCGLLSPEVPVFLELQKTRHGTFGECHECGVYGESFQAYLIFPT
jgi:hypothetical protein